MDIIILLLLAAVSITAEKDDINCRDEDENACQLLLRHKTNACKDTCVQQFCKHTCGICLTCYSCENVAQPELCNSTTKCHQGELCIVTEALNSQFQKVYQQGCSTLNFCKSFYGVSPLLGKKRRGIVFSGGCCNQNLCNKHDPDKTSTTTSVRSAHGVQSHPCSDIFVDFCTAVLSKNSTACYDKCFQTHCPFSCRKCPCLHQETCPNSYNMLTINGQKHCYHFSSTRMPHSQAKDLCTHSREACESLARIESESQNIALTHYISENIHHLHHGSSFWIDGITRDVNIPNHIPELQVNWTWDSTGFPIKYNNFRTPAYNNGGPHHPERSLIFGPGVQQNSHGYQWDGTLDEERNYPLCEYVLSGSS